MGIFIFFFLIFFLALQTSNSTTLLVDGVTHWPDPTAYIGDTIVFKHKNEYNLYIFRNKKAFNTCNFTQATHLSNPNSTTYTWHPSRVGNFYFSFDDGTNKPCKQGQKLAVKINPVEIPPAVAPWPNEPRANAPEPSMTVLVPGKGGSNNGRVPFINSNPAFPLPSGEVDSSTTIGSLPKPVNHASKKVKVKVVGLIEGLMWLSMLCNYVMVVQ